MSYQSHFQQADDIIAHLNAVMPGVTDPLLVAKYVGFVSVASVAVYEVAIKNIFIEFAKKKNGVFGCFVESYFFRINGRIAIRAIREDYIKRFGQKYLDKFDKKIAVAANDYLRANGRDIRSSYGNLITWRNDFAHEGRVNSTSTYNEVVVAYEDGKEVIRCLFETMAR